MCFEAKICNIERDSCLVLLGNEKLMLWSRLRRNARPPPQFSDLISFPDRSGVCFFIPGETLERKLQRKRGRNKYQDREDLVVAPSNIEAPGAGLGLYC